MAKSSIADVYVAILPSMSGISNSIKKEFRDFGNFASDVIAAGIEKGTLQGITSLSNALGSAAEEGSSDFNDLLQGVRVPNDLLRQFERVAQQAGDSFEDEIGDAATDAMRDAGRGVPPIDGERVVGEPLRNSSSSGLTSGLRAAGPKIAGIIAGLGIGAAIAGSITSGLEKEAGGAKTVAALGLNPEQAKRAGEVAGSLYAGAYGESMEHVQQAVAGTMSSIAGMRDADASAIEEVTKKTLNMAAAFEIDTARAVQVANQMIVAGLASDAPEALDLLSAAMQKVPANVREEVMDAMDEYGPFMRALGMEGEGGLALLVKGAEKGVYGIDKLGDAIKEFTIRSTDMSEATGGAFEQIGLDQAEMTKALLEGGDGAEEAFGKIISSLRSMKDPVAQSQAALALFGTPLEDLSVNEIPSFLESLSGTVDGLGDVTAAAAEMDATLAGTSAAAFTSFKRTVETVFADALFPLIKEFEPILQDVSVWLVENQGKISEWARVIVEALQNTIGPALETLMPILGAVFSWLAENEQLLQVLVPVIIQAGLVFGGLWLAIQGYTAVAGVIGFIKGLGAALTAGAGASTLFGGGMLLLAGKIALVVAAILAVMGATIWVIENFPAIIDSIGGFFRGIWDNITALTGGTYSALGAVGGFILGLGAMVANAVIGILNLAVMAINALLIGISTVGELVGLGSIPQIPTIPFIEFSVPALATGADVMGPTVALIGEKDPETVVDRGKMNALIDNINEELLGGGGKGGDTYIEVSVQAGPADTPEELAQKVAQAIAFAQKRG